MPISWNLLSPDDSGDLILTSDYPATGRTVAGFADLFAGLPGTHAVWETAPPRSAGDAAASADERTGRWAAEVRESGRPVRAVLGFCVGSVFAAGLAERIAEWSAQPPRLILFDPERPDPGLLHRHYRELMNGLAAYLGPGELETAQRAGDEAARETTDMAALALALANLFAEHGGRAFARTGLDAVRSAELVDTFRSFLRYLVAAADLDPRKVWAQATALSSATATSGLNALPDEERARTTAREIRFDVGHTELLRDDEVIRTVRDLMF